MKKNNKLNEKERLLQDLIDEWWRMQFMSVCTGMPCETFASFIKRNIKKVEKKKKIVDK